MQRYDGDVSDIPDRYALDTARFWTCTVAAAVVAALVGLVIARGLVKVPVLAPPSGGGWGDVRTAVYAIVGASVVVLAGALMHLLIIGVAEPRRFFVWIMTLVTLIAMIIPLVPDGQLGVKIAITLIILTIGTVTTGIVQGTAVVTCRPRILGDVHGAVAPARQWTVPPTYHRAGRRLTW